MSRLLVDEEFVAVQPSLVRALDGKVIDALVLQYLHFWLRVSNNEYDGEIWVYNTYQDWSDKLGISSDQARRSIERLEKVGVILSCQPQAGEWNHRKWYRIDYSHSCLIDLAELPDRSGVIGRSSIPTERTTEENILPPALQKQEEPRATEKGGVQDDEGGTDSPAPASAKPAKEGPDDNPDPEVVRLCTLLADLYQANGNTRPNPNQKGWYRECRLLLTKDGPEGTGRPPDKVEKLLRWSMESDFWKSVIRSMPNFRKHYDAMREQANKDHKAKSSSDTDRLSAYKAKLEREAAE